MRYTLTQSLSDYRWLGRFIYCPNDEKDAAPEWSAPELIVSIDHARETLVRRWQRGADDVAVPRVHQGVVRGAYTRRWYWDTITSEARMALYRLDGTVPYTRRRLENLHIEPINDIVQLIVSWEIAEQFPDDHLGPEVGTSVQSQNPFLR